MRNRPNMLTRLRRWNAGAGRYLVGLFAAAYLSAGLAPCLAVAAEAPNGVPPAHRGHATADPGPRAQHVERADEAGRAAAAHHAAEHGAHAAAKGKGESPPAEENGGRCPHCAPGMDGAAPLHTAHDPACSALDELTNVAQSQFTEAATPAPPLLTAAPLLLPPPLASPLAPPAPAEDGKPTVPINVRHCVFLI